MHGSGESGSRGGAMGLFKKKPADEQAEEQSASAATPSAAGRKTWRPTFSFGRKKGPAGETPSGTRESEEKLRRGSPHRYVGTIFVKFCKFEFCQFLPNLGGLVLGYIEADFCE